MPAAAVDFTTYQAALLAAYTALGLQQWQTARVSVSQAIAIGIGMGSSVSASGTSQNLNLGDAWHLLDLIDRMQIEANRVAGSRFIKTGLSNGGRRRGGEVHYGD